MVGLLLAGAVLQGCTSAAPTAGPPLPWEIWNDLHLLPKIEPGNEVLLQSSYCPSGCRYDRHSKDDWRYLRLDGDEGVIFEEEGAGAITRIWMTTGHGISSPLPESVRLRVYIDGEQRPVVDLPLPKLFSGKVRPFVAPLVGHRLNSSGGNYSYVPIPYRNGCRVTLVGAHEEKLWYQLGYHRLPHADDVRSFTRREKLRPWRALLAATGEDPWRSLGEDKAESPAAMATGTVELVPGKEVVLASFQGADSLTAVRLRLPEEHREEIGIRMDFDGERRVEMLAADFFGTGAGGGDAMRSLLVGTDQEGWLYVYFPMPFEDEARVSLVGRGTVSFEIRRANRPPLEGSALFGAQMAGGGYTLAGVDTAFLDLPGTGKWVGLFTELGKATGPPGGYLEGDERIYLNGSSTPTIHGTGTEDIFNAGFYFDQGAFQKALHGAPYGQRGDDAAAYRFMLSDAIPFTDGIRAELEGGPTGELPIRLRSVSYYYLEPGVGGRLLNLPPSRRPYHGDQHGPPFFADDFETGDLAGWSGHRP